MWIGGGEHAYVNFISSDNFLSFKKKLIMLRVRLMLNS